MKRKDEKVQPTIENVIAVIAETFAIEPEIVTSDYTLKKDLKADSLEIIDLIFTLEKEFKTSNMTDSFQENRDYTIAEITAIISAHSQNSSQEP
jgi:acyl carrier protein